MKTSPREPSLRNRRGFSLIEMSVVIVVLAMAAALIVPNLAAQRESQIHREFRFGLRRFVADARESAIDSKEDRVLRYESASRALEIQVPANDTDRAQPETLRTLELPEGVAIDGYRLAGQSVSEGEWELRFFPDGTSDGGGIELTDGGLELALAIDKRGASALDEGRLPEATEERWIAGEHEKRL